MDFQWVAIALGDVVWIALAFVFGFLSRLAKLPPLVGFLATGYLLNAYGISSGEVLNKLSDLGITLLLFTVGLKINLRTLARPQVWAVASLCMSIIEYAIGVPLPGNMMARPARAIRHSVSASCRFAPKTAPGFAHTQLRVTPVTK